MATASGHTSDADDDSVEAAVTHHGGEMFGLALAITGNRPDAEEAYQTAWLSAIRHWDQLRQRDRRRSWLASTVSRAALRVATDRNRRQRRTVAVEAAVGLGRLMHWDPGLGEALSRLSSRQRAVVTLHYWHGYSLDETARLLHCRGGTARSHLARALRRLREELDHEQ